MTNRSFLAAAAFSSDSSPACLSPLIPSYEGGKEGGAKKAPMESPIFPHPQSQSLSPPSSCRLHGGFLESPEGYMLGWSVRGTTSSRGRHPSICNIHLFGHFPAQVISFSDRRLDGKSKPFMQMGSRLSPNAFPRRFQLPLVTMVYVRV